MLQGDRPLAGTMRLGSAAVTGRSEVDAAKPLAGFQWTDWSHRLVRRPADGPIFHENHCPQVFARCCARGRRTPSASFRASASLHQRRGALWESAAQPLEGSAASPHRAIAAATESDGLRCLLDRFLDATTVASGALRLVKAGVGALDEFGGCAFRAWPAG